MSHRGSSRHHKGAAETHGRQPAAGDSPPAGNRGLEVVIKADTVGTLEAVNRALAEISVEGTDIRILHPGVGDVAKSDLLMALTGSRLVVGFGVQTMPKVEEFAREQGVEIRLYDVIYDLSEELAEIARSLVPLAEGEKILGQAKVVARFKSSRKGIILGCEVKEGRLALGQRYRVITAMGPVYEGTIESLHIEDHPVKQAQKGQKVGLKIPDFKDTGVGDLVESFEPQHARQPRGWAPTGGVLRSRS